MLRSECSHRVLITSLSSDRGSKKRKTEPFSSETEGDENGWRQFNPSRSPAPHLPPSNSYHRDSKQTRSQERRDEQRASFVFTESHWRRNILTVFLDVKIVATRCSDPGMKKESKPSVVILSYFISVP